MKTTDIPETGDLRPQLAHAVYNSRGVLSKYAPPTRAAKPVKKKSSDDLPIGTQQLFIDTIAYTYSLGAGINTLLTVDWDRLFSDNAPHKLRTIKYENRIPYVVECIRKWVKRRIDVFYYIWVREVASDVGEHWHLVMYLPARYHAEFAVYCEKLFEEVQGSKTRPLYSKQSLGETAVSEYGSWQLAQDINPDCRGYYLGAYLGKGELSERVFRGKLIPNDRKPVKHVEGRADYDASQGHILGSEHRIQRFDMSRELKRV